MTPRTFRPSANCPPLSAECPPHTRLAGGERMREQWKEKVSLKCQLQTRAVWKTI